MGLILGIYVAIGILIFSATSLFIKMWAGTDGNNDSVGNKCLASLFFIGAVIAIIVAIVYASNRGV